MTVAADVAFCVPGDDLRAYRQTLGTFPTGIAVMTAAHEGRRVGLTANSFGSVSLDPPLVLWNLRAESASLPVYRAGAHFGVNVLAWHQEDVSQRFATPSDDKFGGLETTVAESGVPLISGCAAQYECRLVHEFTTGDHVVLIGEVLRYRNFHREPLIFFRGDCRWFDQPVIG
jgi:flavin reductase (DIM6/NTAB) family NADH-FMN oxidoreductase RutF